MSIDTAIEAEVAYRRERVTRHFRPWRRVGQERGAARRHRAGRRDPLTAAAASVIPISR